MRKPAIVISASIGWAVRNYFQTGVVHALSQRFSVLVIATPAVRAEIERQGLAPDVEWIELPPRAEPRAWRLARELRKKIYMEGRRSRTERLWARYSRRPLYQRVGGVMIGALARAISPARLFRAVERIDYRLNQDAAVRSLFRDRRPVLFFATHASLTFEERLLRSAVAEGVPVAFMVLSWDHLSSKFLLSTRYDRVLVWNAITKTEILETYPSYRDEQVAVVGAPQFDIYAEPPSTSYADWCRRWGLDPAKRTVLYTTAPDVRHEQQHIVARDLLEAFLRGDRLPGNLQMFIKCHPFDENPGYDALTGRYPVAVYRPSQGLTSAQEDWIPGHDELVLGRDALAHCAININVFSTVTLEAAYLDKPIVHLAYDPEPVTHRIPTREYYTFDHFKRIVDMDASTMAYSHDELVQALATYLADPAHKKAQRARVAESFLGATVGQSARLVEEVIASRAGEVARRP